MRQKRGSMARAHGQEPSPAPAAKHPPGNRRRFKRRAPACRQGCRESPRDYISRQAVGGRVGRCSPGGKEGRKEGLLLRGREGRVGRAEAPLPGTAAGSSSRCPVGQAQGGWDIEA